MQIKNILNHNEIQSLKNCKNSDGDILNIFHEEDNNLDHTQMVLDNVSKYFANDKDYKVLQIAAVLHDIAKPICRQVNEKGWVMFPNHEKLGVPIAQKILEREQEKLKLSEKDIRRILICVGNHDIYKYSKEELKAKLSYEDLVLVAKLSLCDNKGRISKVATDCSFQEELINMNQY